MNRIDRLFERKREQGAAAMIFYLTAGYPDMAATERVIDVLAEEGVDLIELGIPFSDPIADGPTIQEASRVALEGGATVRGILELVGRVRRRHPELVVVLFGAYNPIFRMGDERFVAAAAQAGADGILIPDLPPEEARDVRRAAGEQGLSMVFLAAPTTPPERMRLIAEASTGFIYYISVKGVTGARAELPADLKGKLEMLKSVTDKPVAVGFGIAGPEQTRAVAAIADGVVVGSKLVQMVGSEPGAAIDFDRMRGFVRSMCEAAAGAHAV